MTKFRVRIRRALFLSKIIHAFFVQKRCTLSFTSFVSADYGMQRGGLRIGEPIGKRWRNIARILVKAAAEQKAPLKRAATKVLGRPVAAALQRPGRSLAASLQRSSSILAAAVLQPWRNRAQLAQTQKIRKHNHIRAIMHNKCTHPYRRRNTISHGQHFLKEKR